MKTLARFVVTIGIGMLFVGCAGSPPLATTPSAVNSAVQPKPGNKTFRYTGRVQRFVVPPDVTSIKVDAFGGAGAGYRYPKICYGPCFGRGGRTEADIPVTPGEMLYVRVGGMGLGGDYSGSGGGGFNGGGSGGYGGYWGGLGGGGASDVRESGDQLKDRVLVAGGGGGQGTGASSYYGIGGNGGGTTGANGSGYNRGGFGGSQSDGGTGGVGNQGSGGEPGQPGDNGALALGGSGGAGGQGGSYGDGGGGGGGGGGYYGGGGGGGGAGLYGPPQIGNGGGGGSSYAEPSATSVHFWQGWKKATGNGLVVVSWQ
jgi:hypothetical protein